MKITKYAIVGGLFLISLPAFGINAVTGEIPGKSAEEVNEIVTGTLGKLQSGMHRENDTRGFLFRYTSPFMNLYPFDIYIGEYKDKTSIIRIESIDETNKALLDVFSSAATGVKYPYSYQPKSLVLGHVLTFVLPAAGNLYTNIDSLMDLKFSWLFSILYLGLDGALLWMGGTNFFTQPFDPFNTGLAATLILMGTYRAAHMVFNHLSIVAHNNLVGLGYTFQFK